MPESPKSSSKIASRRFVRILSRFVEIPSRACPIFEPSMVFAVYAKASSGAFPSEIPLKGKLFKDDSLITFNDKNT